MLKEKKIKYIILSAEGKYESWLSFLKIMHHCKSKVKFKLKCKLLWLYNYGIKFYNVKY